MARKTKVINMLGGSGIGKSTAAAGLYHEMKQKGMNVELVREYVKMWAWTGNKVGQYDQIYIFGKQARSEYMLYGKVDYIITDSPIILGPVYEKFYNDGESMIEEAAIKFLKKADNNGVEHINFLLERKKEFNPEGRYETEEQAKQVDLEVRKFIVQNDLDFKLINCPDLDRISTMMEFLENDVK
jgi:nicotinamide riboside kinase